MVQTLDGRTCPSIQATPRSASPRRLGSSTLARRYKRNRRAYAGCAIRRASGSDVMLATAHPLQSLRLVEELVTGLTLDAAADQCWLLLLFTDIVARRARRPRSRPRARATERLSTRWFAAVHTLRGREIDTAGDGRLRVIDGPARAIRCAVAMGLAVRTLGLEAPEPAFFIYAGNPRSPQQARGIAVTSGARGMSQARPVETCRVEHREICRGVRIEFADHARTR